ncbi:MAG: hypothetical protein V7K38_14870 [Nostoc sp.]|uniref:hypothetical protein n=1 Tax=Nostoc sp. TaxID=1180 RepID=UPI002FF5669F
MLRGVMKSDRLAEILKNNAIAVVEEWVRSQSTPPKSPKVRRRVDVASRREAGCL